MLRRTKSLGSLNNSSEDNRSENNLLRRFFEDFFTPLLRETNTQSIDFKKDETFANMWGRITYKKWLQNLHSSIKNSIREYTRNSTSINSFLRIYKDIPKNDKERHSLEMWEQRATIEQIEHLDQALKNNVLKTSINVYRVTDLLQLYSHQQLNDFFGKSKDEITVSQDLIEALEADFKNLVYFEHSFVSTSLSINPSGMNRVLDNPLYNKPVLLKITVPKGANVAYISNLSFYPTQNEVLIARQQWYEYKKFSIININGRNTLLVEMELDPQPRLRSN